MHLDDRASQAWLGLVRCIARLHVYEEHNLFTAYSNNTVGDIKADGVGFGINNNFPGRHNREKISMTRENIELSRGIFGRYLLGRAFIIFVKRSTSYNVNTTIGRRFFHGFFCPLLGGGGAAAG